MPDLAPRSSKHSVLRHLRGRKTVEYVRRKGGRFRGYHMNALYLLGHPRNAQSCILNPLSSVYLGVTASAKLHKSAVKRNRMRRRCREALRITLKKEQTNLPVCQLILMPRSSSLSCAFKDLENDAERLLHFLRHAATRRSS